MARFAGCSASKRILFELWVVGGQYPSDGGGLHKAMKLGSMFATIAPLWRASTTSRFILRVPAINAEQHLK